MSMSATWAPWSAICSLGCLLSPPLAQAQPVQSPLIARTEISAPAADGVRVQVIQVTDQLASPWALAFLPDGRMLVTEKQGRLRTVTPAGLVGPAIGGVPEVDSAGQGGLLDLALDPGFAANRRIYLSYAERDTAGNNGTAVARAELDLSAQVLRNLRVIYRQLPKASGTSGHYGSRMVFDRSGHLFVTLGDRQSRNQRGFAQDLSRGNGKVVRITTEGAAAAGNPGAPTGAVPGLWSWGHRNPQGAALHPVTGELWTHEHGPQGGDEVNRTLPGRNYGWPLVSHGQEYGSTNPVGDASFRQGMEPAAAVWETRDGSPYTGGAKSSIAPSGMAFYTGDAFGAWKGQLFLGALAGTAVWRLVLDGHRVVARTRLDAPRDERIRDVRQGPDGLIYLLTDSGKLLRLQPQP
jgi:aldose sugar dehydrogenase